jgi:hypothetical protein
MHVDDGFGVSSCPAFRDELLAILTDRYGPLTYNPECKFICGVNINRLPSGAVNLSFERHLSTLLPRAGMQDIPACATPSSPDLFSPPLSASPPTPIKLFQSILGSLIYLLPIRHDIAKEVTFLATKSHAPTADHLARLIRVLQYLKGTPSLGPTFFTSQGPILSMQVDAAHGVHTDGRSHFGFSISVGSDSAPFYVKSSIQSSCVAISAFDAEYVALSEASKRLLHYRYLAEALGFPQTAPSIIYEDNLSAINLAHAPQISRKSRHIHTRFHFIRDLVFTKQISVLHLRTDDMTADMLTKSLGPSKFFYFRSKLLNIPLPFVYK